MTSDKDHLDAAELRAALDALHDWRSFPGALQTCFHAPSARAALDLVAAVGDAAEAAGHHPDLDWRYDRVFVRTTSHDVGGAVTARDVRLATTISELARRADATADPGAVREVAIAIDAARPERLRDAWAAALGYEPGPDDVLTDPWGRGPVVWFQRTETPAESRLHVDVYVPEEDAEEVVARVSEHGAPVTDAQFAPSWWVHTDADGNRLCVCTSVDEPEAPEA